MMTACLLLIRLRGCRGANFTVTAGGGPAVNIITADQEAGRVSLLCMLCYPTVPAVLCDTACCASLLYCTAVSSSCATLLI